MSDQEPDPAWLDLQNGRMLSRWVSYPEYCIPGPILSSKAVLTKSHMDSVLYRGLMTFGTRLADARRAMHMNGEELGLSLGEGLAVAKQTISNWETDRYQPSLEQLAALCKVLHKTADELLLGLSTEGLSPAALERAREYQLMTPAERQKLEKLQSVALDSHTDKPHTPVKRQNGRQLPDSGLRLTAKQQAARGHRPNPTGKKA